MGEVRKTEPSLKEASLTPMLTDNIHVRVFIYLSKNPTQICTTVF